MRGGFDYPGIPVQPPARATARITVATKHIAGESNAFPLDFITLVSVMVFAQIYECSACGDVWRGVSIVEDIDCDRDSVEYRAVCACGRDVLEKFAIEDGERVPCWHPLTDDEIDDDCMSDDEFDE